MGATAADECRTAVALSRTHERFRLPLVDFSLQLLVGLLSRGAVLGRLTWGFAGKHVLLPVESLSFVGRQCPSGYSNARYSKQLLRGVVSNAGGKRATLERAVDGRCCHCTSECELVHRTAHTAHCTLLFWVRIDDVWQRSD